MTGKYLTCDAPGCDHQEDMSALTEDLIGRPCPKCGASLLTREDYEAGIRLYSMMDVLEKAGMVKAAPVDTTGEKAQVNFHVHAGSLDIKITGV